MSKTVEQLVVSLFFTVAFFAGAGTLSAEQRHEVSLSVTAETTQTRDRTQSSDEKDNFSATTTTDAESETCSLEIEISNATDQKDAYQLEWFFISKKKADNGDEKFVILDFGKSPVSLLGGAGIVQTVQSKPFVLTTKTIDRTPRAAKNNNVGNSTRTRSGDTYAGYIVLLKAGDEILAKESNESRFLEDEWLERCKTVNQPAAKRQPPAKKKN